ncbi:MAG TPA: NADH-quinone oxidoreductase subunit N, partial [Chryseosolibacter sp.]|nr:NADH-quinone oxidoreductase subunit N [Chryseosolibacter sp.]
VGFFKPQNNSALIVGMICFGAAFATVNFAGRGGSLFGNMVSNHGFSDFLKLLVDFSAILTCIMAFDRSQIFRHRNEFVFLLVTVVLGAHLLLMSNHLLMIFLSMEVVSIGSYILVAFSFDKFASEGSLKYFLFGATASAVMLYGFSLLYGVGGSVDISATGFANARADKESIVLIGGCMALAGFLFKMSAAPMHPWVPDVYQAAPFPVIAFLSTVPKLAGVGAMARFVVALNGSGDIDWPAIIALLAIISITVGNVAALAQKNPKRLMAYSSIAQSGFLAVGIAAFLPQGLQFTLFYAAVYVLMNFSVFVYLAFFEARGLKTIDDFAGSGRLYWFPLSLLVIGLIALTGLPPTAGFTGKVFIFSSVWESYQITGKFILVWLLVLGLLNTVISLFYYLKIPYYAFLKRPQAFEPPAEAIVPESDPKTGNFVSVENLLGLILVLLILVLFLAPGLLMGWINKVNFAF